MLELALGLMVAFGEAESLEAELAGFPSRCLCDEYLRLNRVHYTAVQDRLCALPYWDSQSLSLVRTAGELDALYDVWDTLRSAQWPAWEYETRRKLANDLREKIGPEAYARGLMPAPVPLWRFVRLD